MTALIRMRRWALPCALLLALAPAAAAAQYRPAPVVAQQRATHPITPEVAAPSACRVAAFALGGAAGFTVGALIGVAIERTLSSAEDAGITGLAVGGIFGAIVGSQLARGACDDRDEGLLRARLRAGRVPNEHGPSERHPRGNMTLRPRRGG